MPDVVVNDDIACLELGVIDDRTERQRKQCQSENTIIHDKIPSIESKPFLSGLIKLVID